MGYKLYIRSRLLKWWVGSRCPRSPFSKSLRPARSIPLCQWVCCLIGGYHPVDFLRISTMIRFLWAAYRPFLVGECQVLCVATSLYPLSILFLSHCYPSLFLHVIRQNTNFRCRNKFRIIWGTRKLTSMCTIHRIMLLLFHLFSKVLSYFFWTCCTLYQPLFSLCFIMWDCITAFQECWAGLYGWRC